MRTYLLLLLMAFTGFSYGQSVTLKGKILDPDNNPLESATIYLSTVKDSTLIDYTISNKNGNWELKTRAIKVPVYLKISFVGFSGHRQLLESVTQDTDLGTITLSDKGTELGEIVIEGEVPPIRIKKDTLEFDAASFAVRPDANVQELLKQLPGVEIDAEGNITVNGKKVSQILVNGKPFFDKDGKIALQNLPADIINKIQVSDKKTKEEELTGQNAKSNDASINITIDEEKNKGFMGRLVSGFGTDGRYEHSGLLNYFKGDRKISVLASTNNINSTGFSMDEIFDNMSGGRNVSIWSDGSSYNINGIQFGGGKGITRSDMIGLNYADKWAKGFDGALNYFYTAANTRNNNLTRQTNFLPEREDPANPGTFIDDSYVRQSSSRIREDRSAHNFNTQFEIAIDSTLSIYMEPKFIKGHTLSSTTVTQSSERLSDARLLNDNQGLYAAENNNSGFSDYLVFTKKLGTKKGRSIGTTIENENNRSEGYNLNNTVTNNYDYTGDTPTITSDIRNQRRNNRQTKDNYIVSAYYYEPVKDSTTVLLSVIYGNNNATETREGYDFNPVSNRYNTYNSALSGYLQARTQRLRPVVGYNIQKNKMWLNFQAGPRFINFEANGSYLGTPYTVSNKYTMPSADAQFSFQMTKTKSIWASYSYDFELPSASQVLPVADVINPLSTLIGYEGLGPRKFHNLNFNFDNYDYSTRTGFSVYMGGEYNQQAIVGYTEIDENARSTVSYRNAGGTYNGWLGGGWGKSFKKDAHDFKFNIGLHNDYSRSKGYLNTQLFDSKTLSVQPRINLTYKYGELFTINPSYTYSYNTTSFSNYTVDKASNFIHRINLATTSYWPKHVVFGNDIGYNYNSQLGAGFKKDFYLWNASLGYNFWKDQLTFKVKVYDLLNQNQANTRTIGATTITDEQNVVLKRYVMFSLTLKLNKFGAKKEEPTTTTGEATEGIITF